MSSNGDVLRVGSVGSRNPARHLWRLGAIACLLGCLVALGIAPVTSGASKAKAKTKHVASAKHVTITFASWADETADTVPGIESVVKLYEEENPNVTIIQQPISYTTMGSRLLLEVRSHDAPTVAESQGDYTPSLYRTGDLVTLAAMTGKKELKKILPKAREEATYTKHFVAMPWVIAPIGLWYNKKLVKEAGISSPPSTVVELEADLAKVRAKFPSSTGVVPFGFDTSLRTYGFTQSYPFMQDFGVKPFGKTAKDGIHVTTKKFEAYLSFIRLLGTKGYDIPDDLTGHFRPLAADTEVVFDADGPYFQSAIQTVNHDTDAQFDSTWGVTTIPSGSNGKHYAMSTDHQLIMFKSAKNKAAAFKFINWLATSSTAIKDYSIPSEDALPPLKTDAKLYSDLADAPTFTIFSHTIEPTVSRPPYGPIYNALWSPIMAGVEEAMTTSTPLTTIMATIKSKSQTALASVATGTG